MDNYTRTPEGQVVLRYYQPVPKLVKVGTSQVYFNPKFGVSLAFVDEELVTPLLGVLGGCCGGKKHIISLATPSQYQHWQDGLGGR